MPALEGVDGRAGLAETVGVPPALRSRLALFALLGAFLIPITTSSLRGLTHVVTCKERTETPFTIITPKTGNPIVTSSTRFERGPNPPPVCGGLALDVRVRSEGPGRLAITLPITNNTRFTWRGTVTLRLGKVLVPAAIGDIPPGETRSDTLHVKFDPGSREISGSLLVGP
jgi:hypothetical protein